MQNLALSDKKKAFLFRQLEVKSNTLFILSNMKTGMFLPTVSCKQDFYLGVPKILAAYYRKFFDASH